MSDDDFAVLVARYGDVIYEIPGLAEAIAGRPPRAVAKADTMGRAPSIERSRVTADTVVQEVHSRATVGEIHDSYETLPEGGIAAALKLRPPTSATLPGGSSRSDRASWQPVECLGRVRSDHVHQELGLAGDSSGSARSAG